MPSPNTTFRLGPADDAALQHLQRVLGARSRTDVIRTALHVLSSELTKREKRIEDLLTRLEQLIPAFDRGVVDEAGFDPRRERAFARVDAVTYVDMPAVPLIFAQRVSDDGTLEKTLVEEGGENSAKRVWIEPVRFDA